MGKELSELIVSNRNINSLTKKYKVSNVGIIDGVSFQSYYKQNKLQLYIPYNSLSEKERNVISNTKKPVTFFEVFGLNDTFKKLFDEIKKSTTLSKKEISELIRYDTKCVDIIHDKPIIFTLNIEHTDILK